MCALLTVHSVLVGKSLGLHPLTDKEMEVQRREGAYLGTSTQSIEPADCKLPADHVQLTSLPVSFLSCGMEGVPAPSSQSLCAHGQVNVQSKGRVRVASEQYWQSLYSHNIPLNKASQTLFTFSMYNAHE